MCEARTADFDTVNALFQHPYLGSRQFSWDDWRAASSPFLTLMANEEGNPPWGAIVLEPEPRPSTLPEDIPNRIFCRGVAVARGRTSARDVRFLLESSVHQLHHRGYRGVLMVVSDRTWLAKASNLAGLAAVEHLQYLHRRLPAAPISRSEGRITAGGEDDIPTLAQRDVLTFSPLWHMGERELRHWHRQGTLSLLHLDGRLAGYLLYTVPESPPELERPSGFIVRLAVWPEFQGRRGGTHLLYHALRSMHRLGLERVKLNTLASDARAAGFYRRHGFRPLGRRHAVMLRTIAPG